MHCTSPPIRTRSFSLWQVRGNRRELGTGIGPWSSYRYPSGLNPTAHI